MIVLYWPLDLWIARHLWHHFYCIFLVTSHEIVSPASIRIHGILFPNYSIGHTAPYVLNTHQIIWHLRQSTNPTQKCFTLINLILMS